MRKSLPFIFAALVLVALGVWRIGAAANAAEITVDAAARLQPLEGWEVTIRGWEQDKARNRYDPSWYQSSQEAVRKLVDEAGINRLRLEVRTGVEADVNYWKRFVDGEDSYKSWSETHYANVNDNDDPFVINPDGFHWGELDDEVEHFVLPMQKRLAAQGEKLFVNLCVVDFRKSDNGSLDLAAHPQEYAEFVLATFEHLKEKYGLAPDALEIMLEPENSENWTPAHLGPAAADAQERLADNGFTPEIIAPSTVRARNAIGFFDAAEKAGAKVDVLSYHSYDRPGEDIRRAIAERAAKAGAKTAMLEHLKADVNEFYRDMTVANVSAWQQWAIAGAADNGNTLFVGDPLARKGHRLKMSRRGRLLSAIWRNARIGDARIEAQSDEAGVRPLAFIRPDGAVVLTAIVDGKTDLSVSGIPPGDYRLEMTSAFGSTKDGGAVTVGPDGRASFKAKSRGVVALVPVKS